MVLVKMLASSSEASSSVLYNQHDSFTTISVASL